MTTSCRSWWRNCALEADSEILAIDRMEDHIAPIAANVSEIRELISSLELGHHKAERWVGNIIEAIGAGDTKKGVPSLRGHSELTLLRFAIDTTSLALRCSLGKRGSTDQTRAICA